MMNNNISNKEANKITREKIQLALMKLMGQRPFNSITISEITKCANVSRVSFYRNFNSKEDVINDACKTINERIKTALFNYKDNYHDFYLAFFKIVKDNKEEMQILLDANIAFPPSSIINEIFNSHTKKDYYNLIAKENAFSSILIAWFKGGMQESPEEMAIICNEIINAK